MTDIKWYKSKIYIYIQRFQSLNCREKTEGAKRKKQTFVFYIFRMHYCPMLLAPHNFKNSSTNFLIPAPKAFPRIKFYIISSQQLRFCLPDLSTYLWLSGQEVISCLYTAATLSNIKMIYKLCRCCYY